MENSKAKLIDQIVKMNNESSESDSGQSVLWLGQDAFESIYKYMVRYVQRYQSMAFLMLFSLKKKDESCDVEEFMEASHTLGVILKNALRNSDVMMQARFDQYVLLLPEIDEEHIGVVINRVKEKWETCPHKDTATIDYRMEEIESGREVSVDVKKEPEWVIVVDDDTTNLKMAGTILSKNNMRVTALKSGKALLEYLNTNEAPDLILLDIAMPEMDGFETLSRLQEQAAGNLGIPVVFLTANDDQDAETRGLKLGAMDFIKKPFVPEVLVIRVRHLIQLVRLQNDLTSEVKKKTEENEELSLQIVQALAGAIDAKDAYTNGHSSRVAKYSRDIAMRYGYSLEKQNRIFMMGLLHDVGKIGIPNSIINKPGRLTDEEFEMIKSHPTIGAQILSKIKMMPELAVGAHWHHERYGGGGYPDGISGNDIPEEARIIAVADAYDAMTSFRSYRDPMPQERVREEIVKGKGTQFDPVFADCMLQMIDEDKDYKLREPGK